MGDGGKGSLTEDELFAALAAAPSFARDFEAETRGPQSSWSLYEGLLPDTDTTVATGARVDQYEVMALLGRGGMGEVYLARDVDLGRKVALKFINRSVSGAEGEARFRTEARATARFNHPNIVTIHTVGSYRGRPYFALAYVVGETLRERMDQRPLGVAEALRIGLAIATALEEAHANGVVHRDLKPDNVLIGADGRVRVLDFGLAKLLSDADGANPKSLPNDDGTTSITGTPPYMAPEQWDGRRPSPATDVWQLGVILYELLEGQRPFGAPSLAALRNRIVDGPPAEIVIDDEPIANFLRAALSLEMDQRPSASEAADCFTTWLAATKPPSEEAPFRGLLPFGEDHACLFFGRDEETAAIVELLEREPTHMVAGPSGAGKSSMVHAGVVPRLRELGSWVVVSLRPGDAPLDALSTALLQVLPTVGLGERVVHSGELARDPAALGRYLRDLARTSRRRVLLVVDQLEELFTQGAPADDVHSFLTALFDAADHALDPIRVLVTLRADFIDRVATVERRALRSVTYLQPPDARALTIMLSGPLERVGYKFGDDRLARDIVAEVADEVACLPLLEFAAERLWRKRERDQRVIGRAAYDELGGVAGALARHADGIIDSMSDAQRDTTRAMMLRLVTAEGTRRTLARSAVVAGVGGDDSALDRLIDARLIIAHGREGAEPVLELAHESLLQTWQTLATWIDDGREEVRFLAQVEQAAELWQRRGERTDELWVGDALVEALVMVRRVRILPDLVSRFVAAAQRRDRSRKRQRNLVLAAVIVALAVFSLAMVWQRSIADEQRDLAEQREHAALHARALSLFEAADADVDARRVIAARAKLRLGLETTDSLRGRALWWRLSRDSLRMRRRFWHEPRALAFSHGDDNLIVAMAKGPLQLVEVATARTTATYGSDDGDISVASSPDGRVVATAGSRGRISLWDAHGKALRQMQGHSQRVHALAFAPDGQFLASGSIDGSVRYWHVGRGTSQRFASPAPVWGVATDGQRLAAVDKDGTLSLWNLADGTLIFQRVVEGALLDVRFSPDGRHLVTAGDDRQVRFWNVEGGEPLRTLSGHGAAIWRLAFSKTGRQLASAGNDNRVVLWDVESGTQQRRFDFDTRIDSVALTSDGSRIAVALSGGYVEVHEVAAAPEAQQVAPPLRSTSAVVFSPDGKHVASADGTAVRLWGVTRGALDTTLVGHTDQLFALGFSPDGAHLLSGGWDLVLREWDVATSSTVRTFSGHTKDIMAVSVSPDGRYYASAGDDNTVRLWSVERAVEVGRLEGHDGPVVGLSFRPDAVTLASASHDGTVRVWDVESGTELSRWNAHTGDAWDVSFFPDGNRVVSVGSDGDVVITDVVDMTSSTLAHVDGRLYSVTTSPDGRHVLAAGSDGIARVWTPPSRVPVELRGHRGAVHDVSFFAADMAATVGADATTRTWNTVDGTQRWSLRALLGTSMLTHNGWSSLGDSSFNPSSKLREFVEVHGRYAVASHDGAACVATKRGDLAVWSIAGNDVARRVAHVSDALIATATGCASRDARQVMVIELGQPPHTIATNGVRALAADGDSILYATDSDIVTLSKTGQVVSQQTHASGISAIAGHPLAIGYTTAQVEVHPGGDIPVVTLQQTPSVAPVRIMHASKGVIAVGFDRGFVGLWSTEDGTRLALTQLHGSVTEMRHVDGTVHALTDLGWHLAWDISAFATDYCTLMQQIWDAVPVSWHQGRTDVLPRPSGHPCSNQVAAGK